VKLFPVRVILVVYTATAVPKFPWKEQLTSSVYNEDCKCRAELVTG